MAISTSGQADCQGLDEIVDATERKPKKPRSFFLDSIDRAESRVLRKDGSVPVVTERPGNTIGHIFMFIKHYKNKFIVSCVCVPGYKTLARRGGDSERCRVCAQSNCFAYRAVSSSLVS